MDKKNSKDRRCAHCNKELARDVKYCSTKCAQNWIYHNSPHYKERVKRNARERYNRLKDDLEFKSQRKASFDKWRKKNREHFNDLCREPNRLRSIERIKERKEQGVCIKCAGRLQVKEGVTCDVCCSKQKAAGAAYRRRKVSAKGHSDLKVLY